LLLLLLLHLLLLLLLLLLQRSRSSFPHLIFKVSSHDHTACQPGQAAARAVKDRCVPARDGAMCLPACRLL
jgi:hypothetical protein